MKDPLAAAVMGPRLALGGATEALDLLQKGQLLGVLAQAPGELNTLMQDPRPINDKAEDLVGDDARKEQLLREGLSIAEAAKERGAGGNGYVLKRNDIEVVNDPSASL